MFNEAEIKIFAQIIGIVMLITIIFKCYYIIKLENLKGRYFPSRFIFSKFLLWPFPWLKSESPEKQRIIRKINIATAVFWGLFALIILSVLIDIAFLEE